MTKLTSIMYDVKYCLLEKRCDSTVNLPLIQGRGFWATHAHILKVHDRIACFVLFVEAGDYRVFITGLHNQAFSVNLIRLKIVLPPIEEQIEIHIS